MKSKNENQYIKHEDCWEVIATSPSHGLFHIMFDLDDFEIVKKHHWAIAKCMNKRTNTYPKFYAQANLKDYHPIFMHRLITNAPKGFVVDHFDKDTCNNRKSNLRLCTQIENLANSNGYCTNRSGRRGVCLVKNYMLGIDKWKAYIMVDGITRNLGFFDSFDAAVCRREEEELRLHRHSTQLSQYDFGGLEVKLKNT